MAKTAGIKKNDLSISSAPTKQITINIIRIIEIPPKCIRFTDYFAVGCSHQSLTVPFSHEENCGHPPGIGAHFSHYNLLAIK